MSETVGVINSGSKKRKSGGRKSQNDRHLKYQDKDPLLQNFQTPCGHSNRRFKCGSLTVDDIMRNRNLLYSKKGKIEQEMYLSRLISTMPIKRPKLYTTKQRKFSSAFFLLSTGKSIVPVCKRFFCQALSITSRRLNNLAKTIDNGDIPKEKRGGDRKSNKFALQKDSVRRFITALPAKESHYNRAKSKRVYLSHELNVKKMHEMYNNTCDTDKRVNITMFRRVFQSDFNIGFSSPATDVCSTCTFLENKLKVQVTSDEKEKTKVELKIHKLRSKAFYEMTKQRPDKSLSICFDMQQIQPIPKTPIQEAYYLRQIGLYNLCFVDMDGKSPTFYLWTENQARKGATEVGSALINYLNSLIFTNVTNLRLFAHGCGGQNKNSHIIHAIMFWMRNQTSTSLKDVTITFPVRGHSYLPADRVFGRVEKELRKHPSLFTKKIYFDIYRKFGNVKFLGEDWVLYDIKGLSDVYNTLIGIRELKRIKIDKQTVFEELKEKKITKKGKQVVTSIKVTKIIPCGLRTSKFYNDDIEQEAVITLLKSRKEHRSILRRMEMKNELKREKVKDVMVLLQKHFGNNWEQYEELSWYESDDDKREDDERENQEDGHDEDCDCEEIDIELRI